MERDKTAGGEKTKISLGFCASANGDKCSIIVVIPRKKPLKNFESRNNLIAVYKSNSKTFYSNVMIKCFSDRVLLPHLSPETNVQFSYTLTMQNVIRAKKFSTISETTK